METRIRSHTISINSVEQLCFVCFLLNSLKKKLKVWLYHQVPAPVTQTNTAVSPPAVEEEPKEDGEEFEDLSAMLEHLGLSEYKKTFDEERIDIESFVRKNPQL